MSKFLTRMSVFAAAVAAALVTMPLAAPVAVADPPAWASPHGDRGVYGHHKFRPGFRRHGHNKRRWRRRHYAPRTVYVYRPAYNHHYQPPHHGYRQRYASRSDIGISPTVGGAIVGGLLGGLGGSQIGGGNGRTVAIIGGVAAGAVIGGSIGRSMEAADTARVQQTLETGRTGQRVIWQNPDTGNRYEVTPTRTYRTADRRDCREYTSRVLLGGHEEQVTGTACRMPDGSWKLQAG